MSKIQTTRGRKLYPKELEVMEINGVKGVFTEFRIKRDSVPKDYYYYQIRSSDYDDSIPCTIEDGVVVNLYGTFMTKTKIEFTEGDYALIKSEDDYGFIEDDEIVKDIRRDFK
jgi:hypothetical protein